MPLTPDLVEQVLAVCRQNARETAAALSRGLDAALEIEAERIEAFSYTGPPPEWSGPGLILVLKVGDDAALVVLAASSGVLPEWTRSPGDAERDKLSTLAQELGGTLLPEAQLPEGFAAVYVDDLAEAITRGGLASGCGAIHCLLKSGETTAAMRLVWPASSPEAILEEASPEFAGASEAPSSAGWNNKEEDLGQRLRNLPSYVRSLLRISVPVSVHLASTKQPVSRVLNIGPGTIIQFEKNCEQPLTICVGNQPVAEGEAVKVGEKFGVKLTQMILPGEKFFPLRRKS